VATLTTRSDDDGDNDDNNDSNVGGNKGNESKTKKVANANDSEKILLSDITQTTSFDSSTNQEVSDKITLSDILGMLCFMKIF
jgi:hypothetical protein